MSPQPQLFAHPVQGTDTDERYTPKWVFDALALTFDLDPAAPPAGAPYVPASSHYSKHDDGLHQPWHGRVWLNPPFSNPTPWAQKMGDHQNGVWLGPVANSAWFTHLLARCDVAWFCRDIRFVGQNHESKHSSMPLAFMAFGTDCVEALHRLNETTHDGVLMTHVTRGAQ